MATTMATVAKPLTMKNYVGYMAGDMANNLAFGMQGMFLMIYYTNVVGLSAAGVSAMIFGVRIYDAFADLLAGRLVDMTRSRWGKFRPWLLFASIPLLLSSVALFTMPNFGADDHTMQYVYATFTYALLGTLYSLVNIPYGSLATAMTQDSVERSRLGVFRSMGPTITMLFLAFVISGQIKQYQPPPGMEPAQASAMLDKLQGSLTLYTSIFVVVGFLLYMVTFFTCREQVHTPSAPITIKATVQTFKSNRPLQILCLSNLIFLLGVFAMQGAQIYYATYVLNNAGAMGFMLLATSVGAFAVVPVVPRVVERVGKKKTFMIGALGFIASAIVLFLLPATPQENTSAWPPTLIAALVVFVVLGFFQNFAMSLLFAFEADAVEYGEYKTGARTAGATYAIYSFFRKMSQSFGIIVVGQGLAFGGFIAKSAENPNPLQPDSAVWAIRAMMGLGPAAFGIIGLLIFAAYPLTDKVFREIVNELNIRNAAKEAAEH